MTLQNVEISLKKISKSLENQHASRELLLKNSRDVVNLASQSIIAIHQGNLKTAKKNIQISQKLIRNLRKKAKGDLARYLVLSEQEFVEAVSLFSIFQKKEIPSITSLGVSEDSYILGLLDCIGEMKRLVFDKIRSGSTKEASRIFNVMENLYLYLYPFAIFDKIVRETRRKLDVNRILVEDTRAALTEEIRRQDLIRTLENLKK